MPQSPDPYQPPPLPPPPPQEHGAQADTGVPMPKGSRWVGTIIFMVIFAVVGDIVFRPLLDIYLLASEARNWGIFLGGTIGAPLGFRVCRVLDTAAPVDDTPKSLH